MTEIQINTQQLFSVFNYLIMKGHTDLTIDTPWVKDNLLQIQLSKKSTDAKIKVLCQKDSFYNCSFQERLGMDAIKSALFASGILKATNWEENIGKIVDETNRDIYQGDKPCRLVFDTNALIFRFYTLIERELFRRTRDNPRAVWGYLVTTGIMGELSAYEDKYSSKDIEGLKKNYKNWFNFGLFTNQLVGSTRQFRMGSVEASKMRASGRCLRIQSEKGDVNIIDAIEKHKSEQNIDIIAASCDGDFISMCRKREIKGLLFDNAVPMKIENESYWEELADLLYTLALRLGAIRIKWPKKDSFILTGIWPRKREDSWDQEKIGIFSKDQELQDDTKRLLKLAYKET